MRKSFPFYRQVDQMDCGPTCLRMVAKFYGQHYSVIELRKKSFINHEGTSLLGISEAAESIGFRTLGIKVPFDKLINEAPLPCIVHWNQNHFVVVFKVTKKSIKIADPGAGLISLTHEEFNRKWVAWRGKNNENGIALLLEPTQVFYELEADDTNFRNNSISYLFSYLRKYRSSLLQLAIGLLTGSLIQLIFPFLTQSIVDIGISTRNVNFIYLVLAGQLMLMIGRTSVEFLRSWILLHLSTRINIAIISDFLIKLMKLPLSFFDQKKIGDLLKRIDDHARIEHFLSSSSLSILFSFFNFIVFGVVLVVYSIPIFMIFSVGSIFYVTYVLLFMKKRRELDYRRFTQVSLNQGNLIELIHGMQDIKLNNCEKEKRWAWEHIQAQLFKVRIGTTRLEQYQQAGSMFINETKNILITVAAAQAVIGGSMTLGMMLAAQYIIGQLNAPITELVGFLREYQDAKISLERISEIHLEANEDKQGGPLAFLGPTLIHHTEDIWIKNLSFKYEGEADSPLVLDDISMKIPKGKITAIVGSSGSGKTTMLKLLLRFYPLLSGTICHGEVDLKTVSTSLWRSKCGVVMQDGYIFSGTLAANIALSSDEIDYTKMIHAARIANLHEHILTLPFGYSTKVEAKGVGLSQGQKQRLLIARAVYKDPEFIFFDEATSSLDTINESIIMNNLNNFFKGRTVVIIAHRLSTVKNAHQIVVLEKGKIVESGAHADLKQSHGAYFELVRNQLELGD